MGLNQVTSLQNRIKLDLNSHIGAESNQNHIVAESTRCFCIVSYATYQKVYRIIGNLIVYRHLGLQPQFRKSWDGLKHAKTENKKNHLKIQFTLYSIEHTLFDVLLCEFN